MDITAIHFDCCTLNYRGTECEREIQTEKERERGIRTEEGEPPN